MFINNKYTTIYHSIIQKHSSVDGEKHHIIPRSLGGNNKRENIVIVPPRIHFILHKLLCRMVVDEKHKRSMHFALFQMMNRKICNFTSRDYERVKNTIKENMKHNNPMHNPDISSLFKKKRPEQSKVAKKRNEEYWATRARPIREFKCPICLSPIVTRIPKQTTCSRSCSAFLQHKNKK